MMNRYTKSLSLLLAALLSATSLLACSTNAAPAATDGSATTATASTTAAPILTDAPATCLSPSALLQKMKKATELTCTYTMRYEVYGKEYEFTNITNLKNGKVMDTVINLDPYGNRTEVKTYYDLENGLHYSKNDQGRYVTEPTDAKWEWIVNGFGLSEILDPASMKKKGDHYEFSAAKAKEWRDSRGFDGDVSITLTEKDGVHTVSLEFTNNSNGDDTVERYTIEFKSDTIRLPGVVS